MSGFTTALTKESVSKVTTSLGETDIGALVFAEYGGPEATDYGATIAGSALKPAHLKGGVTGKRTAGLTGTWRCLGWRNGAYWLVTQWERVA